MNSLPEQDIYTEYDALMRGEKDLIERAILDRNEVIIEELKDPRKSKAKDDKKHWYNSVTYHKMYSPENENKIRMIIRYAIEKYAGWTPEEAYEKMTLQKLGELKLRRLIRYGVRVPYEAQVIFREERSYKDGTRRRIDDGLDPQYVISFAYPELFPYSMKEEILKSYKMILSGEMPRVPKGYFAENYHPTYASRYGYKTVEEAAEWTNSSTEIDRAVVCLWYSWEREGLLNPAVRMDLLPFMRSRKGNAHIRRYHLFYASKLFLNKMEYVKETLRRYPTLS